MGCVVIDELARSLAETQPGLRGFTRPNLFRMRQFYETYRSNEIVSALLRQLPDKNLLRAMLHEFYQLLAPPGDSDAPAPPRRTKRKVARGPA